MCVLLYCVRIPAIIRFFWWSKQTREYCMYSISIFFFCLLRVVNPLCTQWLTLSHQWEFSLFEHQPFLNNNTVVTKWNMFHRKLLHPTVFFLIVFWKDMFSSYHLTHSNIWWHVILIHSDLIYKQWVDLSPWMNTPWTAMVLVEKWADCWLDFVTQVNVPPKVDSISCCNGTAGPTAAWIRFFWWQHRQTAEDANTVFCCCYMEPSHKRVCFSMCQIANL